MPIKGSFGFSPEAWLVERNQKAFALMALVIEGAVRNAKQFTDERGTGYNGHAGRVDTGAMINAIDGQAFQAGVSLIVGQFGFTTERELYFALQTVTGFKHWISGEFIEPTYAFRDALILAVQQLVEGLKDVY